MLRLSLITFPNSNNFFFFFWEHSPLLVKLIPLVCWTIQICQRVLLAIKIQMFRYHSNFWPGLFLIGVEPQHRCSKMSNNSLSNSISVCFSTLVTKRGCVGRFEAKPRFSIAIILPPMQIFNYHIVNGMYLKLIHCNRLW